jgi:thioredoxin
MKNILNMATLVALAIIAQGIVGCSTSERLERISLVSNSDTTPVKLDVAPTSKSSLLNLTAKDDLDAIIRSAEGNVLIDFYADWCGPCKTQGRILHEMEMTASSNKAVIIKINVDEHQDLATKYQVAALPTLILIRDQKIVERQMGLASQTRVASLLSQ